MPPRPRVKIGNVEGRLVIAGQYRQHGALWDTIVNGMKRNPELSSYTTHWLPILCVGEFETTFIVK